MRGQSRSLFLLSALLAVSDGFKFYQTLIPNGDRVSHPCLANRLWQGVGHFNREGGGSPNPFGVDFKTAGNKWSRELCMKDSDGDGRSNGQELGDPTCKWEVGKMPARTSNITHPGVCEPINSDKCRARNKADWELCETETFECNITKGPNVTAVDLKFPPTKIPKKVTNYFCKAFNLPNMTDQHLIAIEPLINNTNVMHHIVIFGCTDRPSSDKFDKPYECGMGGTNCDTILGGWTLGYRGECFTHDSGIRIGPNGYHFVIMQMHWNNPEIRDDYVDSSGLRLHVTTKLRRYDSSMFTIGQRYLEIPPGRSQVTMTADCSSACTSRHLPHHIFLANLMPHMHYAGRFSQISLYRNGSKLRDLLPYSAVNYDEPEIIHFEPPVEMKPGDRIHMKCVYKTTAEKHTLYYGDGTADEMCFGFFRYYPAQKKLPFCLKYGPIDLCDGYDKENKGLVGRIGNCSDAGHFMKETLPNVWGPHIQEHCDYSIEVCRPACKAVVKRLQQDPCWSGWTKKYIEFISIFKIPSLFHLRTTRLAIAACSAELHHEKGLSITKKTRRDHDNSSRNEAYAPIILIAVGSATIGLLLAIVVSIGICRSMINRRSVSVGRENAYITNAGVTEDVKEGGYDNPAVVEGRESTNL